MFNTCYEAKDNNREDMVSNQIVPFQTYSFWLLRTINILEGNGVANAHNCNEHIFLQFCPIYIKVTILKGKREQTISIKGGFLWYGKLIFLFKVIFLGVHFHYYIVYTRSYSNEKSMIFTLLRNVETSTTFGILTFINKINTTRF